MERPHISTLIFQSLFKTTDSTSLKINGDQFGAGVVFSRRLKIGQSSDLSCACFIKMKPSGLEKERQC